jgi:phenylpropionate dioxygenase-like ring-hydroxylating dioxygenase large terminal subunit
LYGSVQYFSAYFGLPWPTVASVQPLLQKINQMRSLEFPSFSNRWSPIVASRTVGRDKPLAVTFDRIPVVLFRDQLGAIQALVDRCPHRSVKLSSGTLGPDGTLKCAFHGWEFRGDGSCRSIPLNPQAKLGAVCAQSVTVEERGGLIWLRGAGNATAPAPLDTPETLDAPGWFGSITTRDWNCHWSRAIQTMLDVAHIPFVHPRSIGAAFGRALGQSTDIELAHELVRDEQDGFRMTWKLVTREASDAGDQGWLAFHPPNGMSLGIPQRQADRQSLLHIWCTPLTATTSRMVVVSRRNFGRFALVPRIYDLLTPVILGEDRRNMETVWPSEVPGDGEVSMPSDAPTIAFQRYYRRAFRASAKSEPRHELES